MWFAAGFLVVGAALLAGSVVLIAKPIRAVRRYRRRRACGSRA
ncbi:MAG: hypothetical protein ACRDQA_23040 [Nocardioidaceae bacterium]